MKNEAYKVSIVSIVLNFFLTLIKLVAGIIGSSASMISDAIHSASDVLSTFVVIIGIKISSRNPDKSHPYGHEKFECVATIILATLLAVVGVKIFISGIVTLINGENVKVPSIIALIVAMVSIIVKELMYQYSVKIARKINSSALLADAWHHRSDALSSIGAFIGILGSILGLKFFDPLASIVIALFIIKVAYDILKDGLDKMLDHACDDETIEKLKKIISSNEKVLIIDDLKTRLFGSKMYVDLEVGVDANLSLIEAHTIAEEIHDQVEKEFSNCKHCMVHVNPKEK